MGAERANTPRASSKKAGAKAKSGKRGKSGNKTPASFVAEKKAPSSKAPSYLVYARRFRPRSFSEVVGQETVTAALRHALRTGRVAQAYLLTGPRGVGKTSIARILAKALNCRNGKGPGGTAEEPCNRCENCLEIGGGGALDVVEMDAATNRGIDDVRRLRESVGFAPAKCRTKVYIVDEVHMLSNEAWNAFLKTLEEPPPHVRFVFATTDPNRIPETILSRCQRFDLRRIGHGDIVRRLRQICEEESVEAEDAALGRIAALGRGGLRDAEGLLDQAVGLGEGKVTDDVVRRISGAVPDELVFTLLTACAESAPDRALLTAHRALEDGADPGELLSSLSDLLRATLLLQTCGPNSPLLEGREHLREACVRLAEKFSADQLLMLIQLFTAAQRDVKDAVQSRLPLETALIRAARAAELVDLSKLVSLLESGGVPRGRGETAGAAPLPPRVGNAPSATVRAGPYPKVEGRRAGFEPGSPTATSPAPTISASAATGLSAAPPPATVAPTGDRATVADGGNRADLPEQWDKVIAAARAHGGPVLAGALTHAAGVALDCEKGRLALSFAPAQGPYLDSLERRERREALQTALQSVYGLDFEVELRQLSKPPAPLLAAPLRSPSPKKSPAASPAPGGESPGFSQPAAGTLPAAQGAPKPHRPVQTPPLSEERSPSEPPSPPGDEVEPDPVMDVMDVDALFAPTVPPAQTTDLRNDTDTAGAPPPVSSEFSPEADARTAAPLPKPLPLDPRREQAFAKHPLVKKIVELTDGEVVDIRRVK